MSSGRLNGAGMPVPKWYREGRQNVSFRPFVLTLTIALLKFHTTYGGKKNKV